MTVRRYRFGLVVESPVLSRGLSVVRLGVDIACARQPGGPPDSGRPIIPKDQIKGTLSHVLRDLRGEGYAQHWFGRESDGARNEPRPGRLQFSDLIADTAEDEVPEATRIKVDELTGAVAEGQLVTIEQPWRVGREVTFVGYFYLEEKAPDLVAAIAEALEMLPAIGAFKSAGFGRIVRSIAPEEAVLPPRAASWQEVEREVELVLEVLEPFCVDTERLDNNLFRGSPVIPGGVLKALFAKRLAADPALWQALGPAFDQIAIGHARPVAQGMVEPARAAPQSLVIVDGEPGIFDVLQSEPGIDSVAPRFMIDWKEQEKQRLAAIYRPPALDRDTRTHTAIDWDTSGAKPGLLFSITSVVPTPDVNWIGHLSCPDTITADTCRSMLDRLHGATLLGLGRTDALLRVTVRLPTLPARAVHRIDDRHVVVCLETPALMCDRRTLEAANWDMQSIYRAYWQERGLVMVVALAQQELRGGHIAIRYPPAALRDPNDNGYEPYVLTRPGATFKLELDGTGDAILTHLLHSGLPLPDALSANADWRTCPYLPTNGYGEIRCMQRDEHRGNA